MAATKKTPGWLILLPAAIGGIVTGVLALVKK